MTEQEMLQAEYDRCRDTGEADLCGDCRELVDMEELNKNYGVCDNCK